MDAQRKHPPRWANGHQRSEYQECVSTRYFSLAKLIRALKFCFLERNLKMVGDTGDRFILD